MSFGVNFAECSRSTDLWSTKARTAVRRDATNRFSPNLSVFPLPPTYVEHGSHEPWSTSPSALLPGPPRACAMSLRRHSALAFVFWAVCCPLRLRAGAAVIQSTDQNIQYTGVWEVVKVNSTTTYAISNTTGAKAVYTFTGQSSNMLKTVRTLSEDLSRDENIRFRSRTSPRLQRWGYTDTVYRSRKRNRSCV